MEQTIRILLIDDHTLFRSGIKALLQRQPGFEVVGEAGNGLDGVKRAKLLKPDVVLLDLHMPGISGREALQLMGEEAPDSHVLILTVSEDSEDLIEALRAGAQGYLLKNTDVNFFVDAVRKAAEGESVISTELTAKLMKNIRGSADTGVAAIDHQKLTPREREILACLAQGDSNKTIARELELAESTVKIHVQSILKKLGMRSRVQAAVYAVEHNLVPKA